MRRVQNPVHPLDLNLNSLMVIYKKFEEAKRMSGNPNQQLPIDLLVQLVSRLINQEPSYLQKQLSKCLIKRTISWNEFLNFLDQESQARENILDWIMYEINTRQFQFHRHVGLKFLGHFDEISYYRPTIVNGRPHTLMLLDKQRFALYDDAAQQVIAQLKIRREKQQFEEQRPNTSMVERPRYARPRRAKGRLSDASLLDQYNSPKLKSRHQRGRSMITASQDSNTLDEDTYVVRQRKKIGSVFEIFKQLPAQPSNEFADFVLQKITQRRLGDVSVNQLKDTYKDYLNKRIQPKDLGESQKESRLTSVQECLRKLHQDKRKLTYDPFKSNSRAASNPLPGRFDLQRKRVSFQKKQKQNDLSVRTLTFLEVHQLLAVALYNFDLVLVQISKQFNKIQLSVQDRIKVPKQVDRKKNEVIERLAFHFHQILQRWQVLVLIRVQGYSWLRVFDVVETNGRKGQSFQLSPQVFSLSLGFEAINLAAEPDFGFHIVGCEGWLKSYKDDLTHLDQHYSLEHAQKLKGEMVVSCMAVSKAKRKMMFGTVGGAVFFYDCLSREVVSTKRASSRNVIEVLFDDSCSQALAFTADQVLTVYDTDRLQQIQSLSVRNQERLNERASMFSLSHQRGEAILSFYGSELRQFISYVDEDRDNLKRKVECTYHWRLKKIDNAPVKATRSKPTQNQEILAVLETEKYLVTMSTHLELKLYSRKSYKVKFSLILALKAEEQLIGFNVSRDAKVLVYSTQHMQVRLINIYTEQVYQVIQLQQKILHLQFLSQRNQYQLVTGSECGKIIYLPSHLSLAKLSNKILQIHRKSVTKMVTVGEYLLTAGEEGLIVVWQMPFNLIKFEINMAERRPREFMVDISQSKNSNRILCRGFSNTVYQLDAKEGAVKQAYEDLSVSGILASTYNEDTNQLYLIDQDLKLTIFEGSHDESIIHKTRSQIVPQDKSSFRKAARKQTTVRPFTVKRKSQTVHPADIPSKWKIKSICNIREKGVQAAKIITNQVMGVTLIFLSKDYFYIYDQLQDRFKGKYNYSTGEFIKNDPKLGFVIQKPSTKF